MAGGIERGETLYIWDFYWIAAHFECCWIIFLLLFQQIRKFRTLTELIVDAQDYIKNPYKGKKIKVSEDRYENQSQSNSRLSILVLVFTCDTQKHPDFPKKPLTPYFRFFMEKRAKYAKLHPEMSNLDLTKILSKKYRELPEKKKVGKEPMHRLLCLTFLCL